MSSIRFLLFIGFLPVLLIFCLGYWIYWQFWGEKQFKKERQNKEFKQKWQEHIRNFDLSRLKNKTWQNSFKKHKKSKQKTKH